MKPLPTSTTGVRPNSEPRHDDGFVEEAARFQVLDERREGLIRVVARLAVQLDIEVVVPRVALGVIDLHHAHAALDKPRRGQAAARRAAFAIYLERGLRFFAHVEDIRRLGLHAIGSLHGADGRFELRIVRAALRRIHIQSVELFDEVEFLALLRRDRSGRCEYWR